MPIVISFDASWGGLGWALCTANKPVASGHAKLGGRAWRMAALREVLAQLEHQVADLAAHSAPGDPQPRVVIERAPQVYSRGNQAATGFGLGEIAGAIELWGCRPTWEYPWLIPPDVWRRYWWAKPPRRRARLKRQALLEVQRDPRMAPHIADLAWDGSEPQDYEGPAGDVAEAILLGVGAARRIASPLTADEAPKGPADWRRARADGTAWSAPPSYPQLFPNRRP